MRRLQICLSLFLVTTCLGQLGNVNLGPLPGVQFVNRTHRLGRGLVAYWPFNERSGPTAFDLSGNGRNGAIDSGIIWTPGKFGLCLDFSGGDYGVNCGKDDVLNLFATGRSGTISFWAKIPTVPGGDDWRLIAKSDHNLVRSFEIFYRGTGDDLWFQVYDGTTRKKVQTATTGFDDGVWRHYCFSVSPTSTKVYINGIDDSTGEVAGNTGVTGTSNFYLGRDDSATTNFFYDGYLDNVMAWNRALSAGEIAESYKERDSWMFKRGDIELMAKSVAAPPAVVPTLYYYSSIPLVIIGYCFILGRKNE